MKLSKKVDNVNHPSHYENSCSLECIEVMKAMFGLEATVHFCLCNAFKYLWRYKNKNGVEDLDKSRWYLNYIRDNYVELEGGDTDIIKSYDRLNDLHIEVCDKIANEGGIKDEEK